MAETKKAVKKTQKDKDDILTKSVKKSVISTGGETKKVGNMSKMKILFVTSEAAPYSRSGGLGDVAGALPQQLNELGADTRIVTPLYSSIPSTLRQSMKFLGSTMVTLGWRRQYCGIFEHKSNGITYYFIDNEYYFKREALYGHYDDAERFAFFARAALDILPIVDFAPDVIHSHDWHSAMTPVFLNVFYRGIDRYKNIKTIFTIHNIEFQGKFDRCIIGDILGFDAQSERLVSYNGCINYMKGAIECADLITTVSESYAKEILNPYYAYGLENILNEKIDKICGVVNGIDIKLYNPETDNCLFEKFNAKTIDKKLENKKSLCELFNLPYDPNIPMIAMVTRLTAQKGIDLLVAVIDELLLAKIQLVIIGTGDWKYEMLLSDLEHKYSNKFEMIVKFNADLAQKIYGASDFILMPSRFEPCGLSQMIAMRYGTVPIVRETGGLKDTVQPYNKFEKTGNGFSFATYNAHDMLNTIWFALDTYYNDKEGFVNLRQRCLDTDFSWKKSAEQYLQLYKAL